MINSFSGQDEVIMETGFIVLPEAAEYLDKQWFLYIEHQPTKDIDHWEKGDNEVKPTIASDYYLEKISRLCPREK